MTVNTPVAELIAKAVPVLPLSISNPPSAALSSPVVAMVRTVSPFPAFSARLAELAVISISASVIVIVISSTYAVLVPSLTFTKIVSDWLVS